MDVDQVVLAEPRGFCAGVEMAIKALAWMVRIFEPPIYCYHEIVHNRLVVEEFSRQGVVFVDDVAEVPKGAPVMLSAHGSAPEVEELAAVARPPGGQRRLPARHQGPPRAEGAGQQGLHRRLCRPRRTRGGDRDDGRGASRRAPRRARVRRRRCSARSTVPSPSSPRRPSPTTSGPGSLSATKARFPEVWMPGRSDLCYATTNRQAALREIAPRCDAVVVIGSANSSNTVSLTHVAAASGCPRVLRVNAADELPDDLSGTVGVTAGASAPEWLVEEVLARLNPSHGVEVVRAVDEEEYFPPPPELRDLLRAVWAAAAVMTGRPPSGEPPAAEDRSVPAVAHARRHRLLSPQCPAPRRTEPSRADGERTPSETPACQSTSSSTRWRSTSSSPPTGLPPSHQSSSSSPPTTSTTTSAPSSSRSRQTLCGLGVSTLVVVDGEDDGTAEIVRKAGTVRARLSRSTAARAQRCASATAPRCPAGRAISSPPTPTGSRDPTDLAHVLQPVVDGEADFVSGSRTLGATESTDVVRNTGIRFFSDRDQLPHRQAGDRHRQPDPGDARRPTRASDPRRAAVPVVGAVDQRPLQRRQVLRAAGDDARPRLWLFEEGSQPRLRLPLLQGRAAHLVAGAPTRRRPAGALRRVDLRWSGVHDSLDVAHAARG